jgi:Ser/Thr protein kinase RdoA (MazF antagonist)
MDAAGCSAPTGWDGACDLVAAAYVTPGPYLALTHGDPAPTNTHVGASPNHVHLLDFEYAGYRHALYDLTAWEVLCPLPRAILDAMRDRYRALLAPDLPSLTDDTGFAAAWAAVVAFRALAILSWIPVAVLEQNAPWVEGWTGREAVLAAVGRLARATEETDDLRPIASLAAELEARLRQRWPDYAERETLPRWAALSS